MPHLVLLRLVAVDSRKISPNPAHLENCHFPLVLCGRVQNVLGSCQHLREGVPRLSVLLGHGDTSLQGHLCFSNGVFISRSVRGWVVLWWRVHRVSGKKCSILKHSVSCAGGKIMSIFRAKGKRCAFALCRAHATPVQSTCAILGTPKKRKEKKEC